METREHCHSHDHCCVHEHEHGHNHCCDHNHDHDCHHHGGHHHEHHHDMAHHDEGEVYEGITITHHEDASIFAFSREIHVPYESVKQSMQEMLDLLSKWVEDHNGIVGHIKAYLTSKKKSAMISTTGDSCNVIEYDTDFTLADVTLIVFGVEEHELCHEIIDSLFLLESHI